MFNVFRKLLDTRYQVVKNNDLQSLHIIKGNLKPLLKRQYMANEEENSSAWCLMQLLLPPLCFLPDIVQKVLWTGWSQKSWMTNLLCRSDNIECCRVMHQSIVCICVCI